MTEATQSSLSEQTKAQIDHWLAKYPVSQKQSAVIAALTIVQKENGGWLSEHLMDLVAEYLQMPKIAVYEVATFYSMFERKPIGKHHICVCTNVSCLLRGSDEIVAKLKEKLGISFGEVTADGKYSLKEVECLAACVNAPCVQIGDDYHENLTPERIDTLLAELE